MKVASGGKTEVVNYFLGHCSDALLKNDKGRSALGIALGEGRRLTAFRDENEALKSQNAEAIEIQVWNREFLSPPADSNPGSCLFCF